MYPSHKVQVTLLTSIKISTKYFNFSDIFPFNSAAELSKYIGINDYSINLLKNKQTFYSLIYSLKPVEIETLKTYIKVNLASSFIKSSKSLADVQILFIRKETIASACT